MKIYPNLILSILFIHVNSSRKSPVKSSHAAKIIGVEKGKMSNAEAAEVRRGILGFPSSLPLRYSAASAVNPESSGR